MLNSLVLAWIHEWAINHSSWRGTWRLGQWTARQQLKNAQHVGKHVAVFGPLLFNSVGTVNIEDYVELRSSWHKPIAITVIKPETTLIIEEHAFINWGVNIGVAKRVTIGAYAQIGDDCMIYDSDWHSLDGTDMISLLSRLLSDEVSG